MKYKIFRFNKRLVFCACYNGVCEVISCNPDVILNAEFRSAVRLAFWNFFNLDIDELPRYQKYKQAGAC